jgi:hypothetical protein
MCRIKGSRFESSTLHQEVLASGGGFQGSEIWRTYKALAAPSTVCDGHLAGLSGLLRRSATARLWPQNSVSQMHRLDLVRQRASDNLTAPPISD